MATEDLKALLEELQLQRAAITAQTTPLRAERKQLAAQIAPVEARLHALHREIKAAEQPALHDLNRQIAVLEAALGETAAA